MSQNITCALPTCKGLHKEWWVKLTWFVELVFFFFLNASLGEELCVVFFGILFAHSYFCQGGRKEVRAK